MKWLLALAVALLASCASKPSPSAIAPPAPPRAVQVAPEVSKLRDQITVADRSVAVIDAGAKEAAKAATAARQEAERLKVQKSASEAELDGLWKQLQTVEIRNLFLEAETSRLAANLTDARDTAAKLQQHAAAKDAEADQLRAGHAHLASMVGDYSKQLAAAREKITKESSRADKLSGEIRLYRVCLGILLTIGIIRIFLSFRYRPLG